MGIRYMKWENSSASSAFFSFPIVYLVILKIDFAETSSASLSLDMHTHS